MNLSLLLLSFQAESGMFPGIILHMTYWYRPDEMSLRLFYLCKYTTQTLVVEPGQGDQANMNQTPLVKCRASSAVSLHSV